MDPIRGRIGSIVFVLVEGERDRLVIRHWSEIEEPPRRVKQVPTRVVATAVPKATPAPFVALKGSQLELVVAELTSAYQAALSAWHLGRVRRRALDIFDRWLSHTGRLGVTEDMFPRRMRFYENRVRLTRQWFGGQSFATDIEHEAYLCSEVEDWTKPTSDDERWIRVWIHLCSRRRVGRPKALEIAGRSVNAYTEKIRLRGGVQARNENYLASEIAAERRKLDDAIENVAFLRRDLKSAPALAEIEARFSRISMLDTLVKDLPHWREHLGESPLWAELIDLRERRLQAVAVLMIDSEPWNLAAKSTG